MYTKLTKTITDSDGSSKTVCLKYGTSMCRIHMRDHGCIDCPMHDAIIEQLAAFEEIVSEMEEENRTQEET